MRNALAQIAKSTVHPADDAAPVTGIVQDDREADKVEQAAEAAAEAAVEILDIPVAKALAVAARISTQDAEQILGSVLEALPEPSEPGTSRARRSRRAGSSGAVVSTGDGGAPRPVEYASVLSFCRTRSPAACSRRSSSRPVTGHAPSAIRSSRRRSG